MEYCFNIYNDKINTVNDYHYTFLNEFHFNYSVFYDILNTYEEFKLKNIYNFLYIRTLKLNEIYGTDKLLKHIISEHMTYDIFNLLMKQYIGKDIVKSIVILNSIQQYYCPLMHI